MNRQPIYADSITTHTDEHGEHRLVVLISGGGIVKFRAWEGDNDVLIQVDDLDEVIAALCQAREILEG